MIDNSSELSVPVFNRGGSSFLPAEALASPANGKDVITQILSLRGSPRSGSVHPERPVGAMLTFGLSLRGWPR